MRSQRRPDTGAVTAEVVVAIPLLMLLILLIIQFGVWAHAQHVAQATASEALSAARLDGASTADGKRRATEVRHQIGRHSLSDTTVTVRRTADTVRVRVTGAAPRVIPLPFLNLPVDASAAGPVERFHSRPQPPSGQLDGLRAG
ncbi:TadE/TadG family type IV pilus assembly protein [Actinomadura darangshiensis]|uniref:TadE/TadG family type IV pilus assembly protein n=1 Tax=Actinomadura darangshiensis TaxID=705336 RepID=UPI001A9D2013|nr:TadE/TadG family type IV pilus assembly protein [Actinomadura darangshiensis]